MRLIDDHKQVQWYHSADSVHCTHGPEPDVNAPEWDAWYDRHQVSDDGHICLDAFAGEACEGCSLEQSEMVPWADCSVRPRVRAQSGMVPSPDAEHEPIPVWVGVLDCLERECEEYFTDDGDDIPDVDRCSHLRAEIACSCKRISGNEYDPAPCPETCPQCGDRGACNGGPCPLATPNLT